jgi:geranylgeranyl diphosphate synthase type I
MSEKPNKLHARMMNELAALVEESLGNLFSTKNFHSLLKPSLHLVKAGGKRIRPVLVLLAYKSLGGDNEEDVAKIAALVECLHTFSLIHDDLIDKSDFRRGVPTVHVKFGPEIALLTGDYLLQLIYKIVCEVSAFDSKTLLRTVNELSVCSLKMIQGELMDIEFETKSSINEDEYIKMARAKTGKLIEHSMRIGAILAGASHSIIEQFGEFGSLLGLAYQIRDDVLDLKEPHKKWGKPVGNDIKEGKRTLIVIHALSHASPTDRDIILNHLGNRNLTRKQVLEVIMLLNKYGSIEYGESLSVSFIRKAKGFLKPLRDSEYKKMLTAIADAAISRQF